LSLGAPDSFGVTDDRHVAQDGDEHQRVDGDVSDDVDDVVIQSAGDVAERPVAGGELVGGQRRDHHDEHQITHGDVQQQQVGVGAHARPRHDDVDDQRVANDADERYQPEQCRNDESVQYAIVVSVVPESRLLILVFVQHSSSFPRPVSRDIANFRHRRRFGIG